MKNNIFEGAKFGDKFLTRDGKVAIFNDFSPDKEVCRLLYKGEGLMLVYTNTGSFYQGNHNDYDIVSRYQEQGANDIIEKVWNVLYNHFNADLPFDKEWFMKKMKE